MAYIERYVTDAAGGGGAGTSGDPWTLAEAFAAAVAGDRVNIQSDGVYNIGGLTVSNSGALNNKILFRGYNSSIGDLDTQGRDSDGPLDITNFPSIVTTAVIAPAVYTLFQNLSFSGNFDGYIVGSFSVDYVTIVSCKVENTHNADSNTGAVQTDNRWVFLNCDLICSGAAHNIVVDCDVNPTLIGCRIIGTYAGSTLVRGFTVTAINCAFLGSTTSIAILIIDLDFTNPLVIMGNTFYSTGTCVLTPDSEQFANIIFINNHCTDNAKMLDNLYVATDEHAYLEANNRTRDNTTPRTGISTTSLLMGEVTTDTGGWATDYEDAPNGDITLIPAAPGVNAGMGM